MFNKIQFFHQKWIITLLLVVTTIPAFGLVYQLATGNPFGTNPIPNWGYILVLILLVGMNLLIFKSN